ncbi:helix-turn-helix domain-containing protein [Thiobacillus sp.]
MNCDTARKSYNTLIEVAEATGIHRMTLSKIADRRGYNATVDVLDRLCTYFGCRIEQLVDHTPDQQVTEGTGRIDGKKP